MVEFPISSLIVTGPEGPDTVRVTSLEPVGKVSPGVVREGPAVVPVLGRVPLIAGEVEIGPVGKGVEVKFKLAYVGIPLTELGVGPKREVMLVTVVVKVKFMLIFVGVPLTGLGVVGTLERMVVEFKVNEGIPLTELGVVATIGSEVELKLENVGTLIEPVVVGIMEGVGE